MVPLYNIISYIELTGFWAATCNLLLSKRELHIAGNRLKGACHKNRHFVTNATWKSRTPSADFDKAIKIQCSAMKKK